MFLVACAGLQEKPPSIEEMLSWNTLTPHYAEDVIYALNAASVAKHFGMDPASAAVRARPGACACSWAAAATCHDFRLFEHSPPAENMAAVVVCSAVPNARRTQPPHNPSQTSPTRSAVPRRAWAT